MKVDFNSQQLVPHVVYDLTAMCEIYKKCWCREWLPEVPALHDQNASGSIPGPPLPPL